MDEKVCAVCGRRITWRTAWERDWEQVRYCSTGCRRRGLRDSDDALETAIREVQIVQGGRVVDPSTAKSPIPIRSAR